MGVRMKWVVAVFVCVLAVVGQAIAEGAPRGLDLASFKAQGSWVATWGQPWVRLGESENLVVYYTFKADNPEASPSGFSPNHPNTDVGVLIATKGLGSQYSQLQVVTGLLACGTHGVYPQALEFSHTKDYDPVSGRPLYLGGDPGLGETIPITRGTILAKATVAICDAMAKR